MRRVMTTLAMAATMVLAMASVGLAAPSENAGCSEGPVDVANHGAHILEHYTPSEGGVAGGAPAHFGLGEPFSPGASFCQGNNNAKALPARP
jgi:hypothetical protein